MTILLVILCMTYLSVGVSDSFLGSAWPSMYTQLNVPVSSVGIISMIIAGGTIISNLFSHKLIKRIGTRLTIAISFAFTCISLLGYSLSKSFLGVCLSTVPYGLATGAISVSLIKYVALHYKLKHMNWLHCSWGLGSTIGPYIVGLLLTRGYGWKGSYFVTSFLHIAIIIIVVFSFSLWQQKKKEFEEEITHKSVGLFESLKIVGAKQVFAAFFSYASLEATAGLWGSSYLVLGRGMDAEKAAIWISLFYMGITFGRLVSGFVANKVGNKKLICFGEAIICLGIILLLLPLENVVALFGLVLVGLGCAPIYPCLLQATPSYFGVELSQSLIGLQMACAYLGSTFMPPLFGLIAEYINIKFYPVFLLLFIIILAITKRKVDKLQNIAQDEGF